MKFVRSPQKKGISQEEMIGFWGMTNFPEEKVTLDLGGRDILIWGSPGHVISEFAFYDTYTQILFTGDMFYRGRCYISFWQPWFDSMKRLIDFVDTHPVTHVMGCHVEISKDNVDYAYGMNYQPDEAPVQMTVESNSFRKSSGSTLSRSPLPTLALQMNLMPSCSMSWMRRSTTSFLSSFMFGMPYISRPPGRSARS